MERLGFQSCTIAITPAHLCKNMLSLNAMYENLKLHVLQNSAIKIPEHNRVVALFQYLCMFETRAPQNQIDTGEIMWMVWARELLCLVVAQWRLKMCKITK